MKRIAITGAARGIGAAIAEELARRGHRVALGDLSASAAAATADRIGSAAVGLELDVTDTASFTAFLAATEKALGGAVDVLVNNAGIMWVGAYVDEPEDAALRQFDVNFHGVRRGMQIALPAMVARGSGHVITIASAGSKLAPAGEAAYAASKHAVLGYCTAVRSELRGTGVDLSVIMPIVVDTDLAAGTSAGRGRRLSPTEVAVAVARTVDRPRFEVFVPREVGALVRIMALLPQRGRDALSRALMPDQVRQTDQSARRAYQERMLGDR